MKQKQREAAALNQEQKGGGRRAEAKREKAATLRQGQKEAAALKQKQIRKFKYSNSDGDPPIPSSTQRITRRFRRMSRSPTSRLRGWCCERAVLSRSNAISVDRVAAENMLH